MLLIFPILCVCFAQFNAIFGTIYAKKQVNSFNLLGTSNIDGDLSHTYNAKSLIECGAFCKAITNCNSFRYDKLLKNCKTYRLWTDSMDNSTDGDIIDIYVQETNYQGNLVSS